MNLGRTLLDEQDWYEKDLSDFDEPQLSDEEYEGNFEIFPYSFEQVILAI